MDVLFRFRPLPGLVLWCGPGLPCFMVSLSMVCPALRPRPCPRTSLNGPRVLSPLLVRRRPPGISGISWLNNTAFHLAVYASCRHLWSTMQDSLTVRSLLAFRRKFVPLGRRCGVSGPSAVPRLSPCDQFLCLCHFGSFFLVSAFCPSPPPCLSRRQPVTSVQFGETGNW